MPKFTNFESLHYSDDSDCGSLVELVTFCPQLHSLFLWNIVIAERDDRELLKQLNILVLFGEASTYGLYPLYNEDEYEQDLSRVWVQEKIEFWYRCSSNRKAIHALWKGLSTHTMGEYIAEVVPNMPILHTSCYSDCKFTLPVLRQCKTIHSVHLRNCTHLTAEMLMLIVTLPCLYKLSLENNTTLEQILPIGENVVCNAEYITILNFTRLLDVNFEYFMECCPQLKRVNNL